MKERGDARRPDVRRYAVLVGEPGEPARVAHDRVVHDTVGLRHGHTLEPFRRALRHVLLEEALLADAVVKALERHGPPREMRHHDRGDQRVILGQLALGDAAVRKHHLLGVRDHDESRAVADDVARTSLGTKPEQPRMSQLGVNRPFDEGDLHHERRPHPVRAQARQPLGLREWRRCRLRWGRASRGAR